jgi:hypothetical protein
MREGCRYTFIMLDLGTRWEFSGQEMRSRPQTAVLEDEE